MQETTQEIAALQQQLVAATQHRRHQESYDALAVQIDKLPSRCSTQVELERERNALEQVKREVKRLQVERELKSRQFSLALASVQGLRVDTEQGVGGVASAAGVSTAAEEELLLKGVDVLSPSGSSVTAATENRSQDVDMGEEEEGELVQ